VDRSGVVLAGGEGRRMGAYKPLVPFRGRPLVAWAVEALRPRCGEVLVACGAPENAAPLAAALPGARILPDPGEGPLGGLVAAAQMARGEWLLVAPGDAPFLTAALYNVLLDAAHGHDGAAFLVDGQLQPLTVALRRAPFLAAADGARSVWAALERMDVARVEAGAWAAALRDVDTPADLADAGP
jgi:molybdopterin-guanine dinucleotide biosynthesis protein A